MLGDQRACVVQQLRNDLFQLLAVTVVIEEGTPDVPSSLTVEGKESRHGSLRGASGGRIGHIA